MNKYICSIFIVIALFQGCRSILPRIEYCNGIEPKNCKVHNDCQSKKMSSSCWSYECIDGKCLCSWICNNNERIQYEVETNGYSCAICKMFVDNTNMMVKMNKTKAEIKENIMSACEALNRTYTYCLNFARFYGDKFVDGMIKGRNQKSCFDSGACLENGNDGLCEICSGMSEKIEVLIHNNIPANEIIDSLKYDCTNFENGKRTLVCPKFLDDYGVKMMQYIAIHGNENSCSIFGACPDKTVDEIECSMCKFVSSIIVPEIAKHHSAYEILGTLFGQCNKLLSKDKCRKFVDTYGLTLIEKIIKNGILSSCNQFKNCDIPTNNEDIKCVLCHMISYRTNIGNNMGFSKESIINDLQEYCNEFSGSSKTQCLTIVNEHSKKMFDDIVKNTPLHFICQKIGMC